MISTTIKVHGEKLLETDEHFYIVIKAPFYAAGKVFGWSGTSAGIGLNREIIDNAYVAKKKLRVILRQYNDRCYEADPKHWAEFAAQKQSYQQHKMEGVPLPTLMVMQFNEEHFKTIQGDFSKLKKQLMS